MSVLNRHPRRLIKAPWARPYETSRPKTTFYASAKLDIKRIGRPLASTPRLPPTQSGIELAITDANWIKGLADNWDDEGARGFSDEVFDRAANLLRDVGMHFVATFSEPVPTPLLSPLHDGSIDLFWRRGKRELLINVPSDPATPSSYFGRSQDDEFNTTSGTLTDGKDRGDILGWLLDC
jgi:hypothetical protein